MATTRTVKRKLRNEPNHVTRKLQVASGQTIYEGTFVSIDANGYATAATGALKIGGLAIEGQGDKSAGEIVTVWLGWFEAYVSLPGVTDAKVGDTAYAADNDTASLTGTNGILGIIIDVETNYAWIAITTRA